MYTVGDYLLDRLNEIGIDEIFGVPGDYNLQFLDKITHRKDLKWIGNANELNASYMADGYARTKKAGAFITTYGVGELSAINGLAGSFAENVPVVEIVGSPTTEVQNAGKLVHHTLGDGIFNHFDKMYNEITIAQTKLTHNNAEQEIDRVLIKLLETKKTVYINLPVDVAEHPATKPQHTLESQCILSLQENDKEILIEIESALKKAKRIVVIAGHEIKSFGLEKYVIDFIDKTKLPVSTLCLGKSAINEQSEQYIGLYSGSTSDPKVKSIVDQAEIILTLGVKLTDSATGMFSYSFKEKQIISINVDQITIFGQTTFNHNFSSIIKSLSSFNIPVYKGEYVDKTSQPIFTPTNNLLTQAKLWEAMADFIQEHDTLVAEQGTSFFGAAQLTLKQNIDFIGQPLWGSIGYTLPAVFGSQIANPKSRHILIIGDGSLQLTAQDLGLAIREKLTPIVFVINNDGYTVEREIHGKTEPYNDIPQWRYEALPFAFGASQSDVISKKISTEQELYDVMKLARADTSKLYWIELILPKFDAPENLHKLGKLFAEQNRV